MTPDRYDGKPFLRLIDCYVLDAIGELAPAQRRAIEAMEPKLQTIYGASGPWQDIVRDQVRLPSREEVRAAWQSSPAGEGAADADDFVVDYVDRLGLV